MRDDKYYKTERFVCHNSGKEWETPGAAEICYRRDEIWALVEEANNHKHFSQSKLIKVMEEMVESGEFDYPAGSTNE